MIVEVDSHSGFCFGVVEAIQKAEETLQTQETLYCLGDIVHNDEEISRLKKLGLITIDHDQFFTMHDVTVLLRAHGEPPSTYDYARTHNIQLIDATCRVVLKLQKRIKNSYESESQPNNQIVIFGKKGHAEVNGLVGQTAGEALVIENQQELERIDFRRPVELYSQTTKDLDGFHKLADELKSRAIHAPLKIHDTVCRQVANRIPALRSFSARYELILFVSGLKSSNGKMLFEICQSVNQNTRFISSKEELDSAWLEGVTSVGICGATSTPKNLLEDIATLVRQLSAGH